MSEVALYWVECRVRSRFVRRHQFNEGFPLLAWCLLPCCVPPSLLGPVVPSFRALSGRLKFTIRRHKFNKDLLS